MVTRRARPTGGPSGRARHARPPRSFGEGAAKLRELMDSAAKFGTDLFDYESWAPRSARAWRLGEVPTEAQTKQEPDEMDLLVANLQRLSRDDYETEFEESFVDEGSLTGAQLMDMLRYKYGVAYDMNFKVVSLPMKRVLSLNIMWSYLGQKSFPYDEEQFFLKLEGIAQTVRQLNREQQVRDFFAKEPKAERGLPAYPTVGTAVIIRMSDVGDQLIDEFFPQSK